MVTLHNGNRSGIDEVELRRKFGQIGDVKSIKNVEYRPEWAPSFFVTSFFVLKH